MKHTKTSSFLRSFERFISSPLVILILFAIAILLIYRSLPLWRTGKIVAQRLHERERRYNELQERDRELDEMLKLLSDDEGKRQILKQYYGLGEDGERIIFLTGDDKSREEE